MKQGLLRSGLALGSLAALLFPSNAAAAVVLWTSSLETTQGNIVPIGSTPTTEYEVAAGTTTSGSMRIQFFYDADTGVLSNFLFDIGGVFYTDLTVSTALVFSANGESEIYLSDSNGLFEALFQFRGELTNQGGRIDYEPLVPGDIENRSSLLSFELLQDGGTAFLHYPEIPQLRSYGGPTATDLAVGDVFLYGTPLPIPEPGLGTLTLCGLVAMVRIRRRT